MFSPNAEQVRRFFCEVWKRHQDGLPLEPIQSLALDGILEHPEYYTLLEDPERAVASDYRVDAGRTNPFLHLSLHLAIAEQLQIDQPHGIRACLSALVQKHGAPRRDATHDALHALIDCLAETLHEAQRSGRPLDQQSYRNRMHRRAGLIEPGASGESHEH